MGAAEEARANRIYRLWVAASDTPENPAQIVRKPSDLKRRLERFLQFHDQQTSGIPGLNILYEGLKVRVTEKPVKKQKSYNLETLTGESCWLGITSSRSCTPRRSGEILTLPTTVYFY